MHSVPPQSMVPLSYNPGEVTVYELGKKTKLYIFCGRLCYISDIFVQAFRSGNEESFLEAQQSMFDFFNGIPKCVIFDNAKIAVKEGFGIYAKPQARYLYFSAHYAFGLDFCNPAKGNEKGMVENLVSYARRNFCVPVPRINCIEDFNQKLWNNCLKYRESHKVESRQQQVFAQYPQELNHLRAIPLYRYDASKTAIVRVDDYSTVKFEKTTTKYQQNIEPFSINWTLQS